MIKAMKEIQMQKAEAIEAATKVANNEEIEMVVTFDPYAEEEDDADKYGYFPSMAIKIFTHEKIVQTIRPS